MFSIKTTSSKKQISQDCKIKDNTCKFKKVQILISVLTYHIVFVMKKIESLQNENSN